MIVEDQCSLQNQLQDIVKGTNYYCNFFNNKEITINRNITIEEENSLILYYEYSAIFDFIRNNILTIKNDKYVILGASNIARDKKLDNENCISVYIIYEEKAEYTMRLLSK